MPTFEEYEAALKARDTVQRLVGTEMERQRPSYRYATVASIDRIQRQATVLFPEGGDPITVQMGSVQPQSVGQVVRIDGLVGDRFIDDVMGPAVFDYGDPPPNSAIYPLTLYGGGARYSGWNNMVQNASAFFGGYDQSSGAIGNYKEADIWLPGGLWYMYSYILKGPNIGWIRGSIDGVASTSVEGYAAAYAAAVPFHGSYLLQPGMHTIRYEAVGKNASSSGYYCLLSSGLLYYAGPLT